MKRLIMYFFAATLLASQSLFAQPTKYLKLGVNYSFFRTEGGKSEPGLTFGFGKDFYPIRSFGGFVGFEVSYARKKVVLENRNWPAEFDPSDSDIVTGDIKVDISFLNLPLNFGYSMHVKNSYYINFLAGISLSMPIKNHTRFENRKLIPLNPEERGKFKFQYVRWNDKNISISLNAQYGLGLKLKHVIFTLIFFHALSQTEGFTNLTVSDRLDSFRFTLSYTF